MKHKRIKELNLTEKIKDDLYVKGLNYQQIAEKYDLNYMEVYRFLRDDKLRNYTDEKLEAIAATDEFNPLSVITHYFQSVQHASKELAFTGMLAEMYREQIAKKIDKEGLNALTKGDNYDILQQWNRNAQKLNKLIELAPKQLEGYINLFSQVLDVQKEVSYVKIVTELLRKEDPALYRKLQKALDADPAAKQVLNSLTREDVLMYWDSEVGRVVREESPMLDAEPIEG